MRNDVRYAICGARCEMWDMRGFMEKGYEKLDIFKLSRELAIKVHSMSLKLPKFEMYETDSLREEVIYVVSVYRICFLGTSYSGLYERSKLRQQQITNMLKSQISNHISKN
ncbi:MAG: hypothetical protein QME25_04655 [Bacteroidota bacterium]|nr:hypothetical protein [Bacteroidota bacterium]